jgi:hypothetical protein
MPEPGVAEYRWLIEGAGRDSLARCEAQPLPLPEASRQLRRHLTPLQTHLVLAQVQLRQRAATRFPHWRQMFFTERALQQATDDGLAAYKAQRFAPDCPVIDLCCGIGGDLLSLAARGPTLGIEQDEVLAYLAAANLREQGRLSAWIGRGDVRKMCILPEVSLHVDPDRRPGGQRSIRLEHHQPGPEWLAPLAAHPNGLALKLAPATDATDALLRGAELEWIGHHRQCQQLVAWFGPLAREPGRRVATLLDSQGTAHRLVAERIPSLPMTESIGRFLVEPAPCVLAAGLAAIVAQRQQLMALTPGGGYLTADAAQASPWATCFEVLEVMPFRVKRLQAWLQARDIGRLEIKKRGVPIDPAQLHRQLRPAGAAAATLIITRQGRRTVAVLARRSASRV